jgi:hypothetical protein
MHSIKDYLREFDDIFQRWKDSDMIMVIGGIWALKLHGLIVRDSEDLDIIVYNPEHAFIDFLQEESGLRAGSIPVDHTGENWRSWKVKRNKFTIDFIMEWNESPAQRLLGFQNRGVFWQVQGISTVIEKKKMYDREKDLKDFDDFKEQNF